MPSAQPKQPDAPAVAQAPAEMLPERPAETAPTPPAQRDATELLGETPVEAPADMAPESPAPLEATEPSAPSAVPDRIEQSPPAPATALPPPPAGVPPSSQAFRTTLDDVYFDYDRFMIRSEARKVLEDNAMALKSQNGWKLLIEGHCDERGTLDYNLVLGERRALAVKNYLTDLGVPASQVQVVSYGKERPFCSDHSDQCWQSNRRAHFVIE
jgi:peptidoglycan-associated lipoprotein